MTRIDRRALGPVTSLVFAGLFAAVSIAAGCNDSDTHQKAPPLASGTTSSSGGGAGPGASSTGTGGSSGRCGDDIKEAGEQCDGPDFGNIDCISLGFSGGTLKCTATCRYDTSSCTGQENCEDGVDNDGDGKIDCADPDCAAACANACTDLPTLADDALDLTDGKTDGHAKGPTPSCASGTSGPETAYKFVAKHTGFLDVQVGVMNGANLTLSIRKQCGDVSTEVACDNENTGLASILLIQSVPVTANDQLTIAIDGFSSTDVGSYTLFAESHPLACGDSHIDPPEQCDDGNTVSGDGCSSTCQLEANEVEPNNTRAEANAFPASMPDSWFGMINPAGDIDCLSIQATANGQKIVAETDDTGDGACALGLQDSYIVIYDGSGTQLASADNGGDGLCAHAESGTELVAGDTYYVCVSAGPSSPGTTFPYNLHLSLQ